MDQRRHEPVQVLLDGMTCLSEPVGRAPDSALMIHEQAAGLAAQPRFSVGPEGEGVPVVQTATGWAARG